MKHKQNQGQTSLIIVFVIGMVSVLIGISLLQTGALESLMGRSRAKSLNALYIAQSGVEEAMYQIRKDSTLGVSSPYEFTLNLDSGVVKTKISGTVNIKTISAIATSGQYVRKIVAEVQNVSIINSGINYAIHAGQKGVILINNTKVVGDVYSNGSISGENYGKPSQQKCGEDSSDTVIDGNATAYTSFEKWNNKTGACVTTGHDSFAYSSSGFNNCYLQGKATGINSPGPECPYDGDFEQIVITPTPILLPDMNIPSFESYMQRRAKIIDGDCIIDGSTSDCTNGTKIIGDVIIKGNLVLKQNVNLFISGPVWVTRDKNGLKGNVNFEQHNEIQPSVDVNNISQLFIVDGKIDSASNILFKKQGSSFIFFISKYDTSESEICDDPAISLASNAESVLFYSLKGCIDLKTTASMLYKGSVIGEKIFVGNNITIEFDSGLQLAEFGITQSGGWQIRSYKEE